VPFPLSSSPGAPCILIVDDDPAVLEVTRRMVRSLGWQPLLADNAPQAVELFREHSDQIDIVLIDLHMPRMSGLEVMHEIRGIRTDARVIVMTGDDAGGEAIATLTDPPAGVLVKPFLLLDLGCALARRSEAV
jgi:CheY-like chemotaxis protein